jgi:hypothetical protein
VNAAVVSGGQPNAADPNLLLWLKADALALGDGATVGTWTASAGSNATAATPTGPTYVASSAAFGGKPAVHFDGADDYFNLAGATNAQEVVIVAKFNAATGAAQSLFSGNPFSGNDPWGYAGRTTAASTADPYWDWYLFFAGPEYSSNPFDTDAHFSFHEAELLDPDPAAPAAFAIRIFDEDHDLPVFEGAYAPGVHNNNVLTLGSQDGINLAQADIAEVLIYDRVLTPDEKTAMAAYLENKYFAVPEPAAAAVMFAGAGLALFRRRRAAGAR